MTDDTHTRSVDLTNRRLLRDEPWFDEYMRSIGIDNRSDALPEHLRLVQLRCLRESVSKVNLLGEVAAQPRDHLHLQDALSRLAFIDANRSGEFWCEQGFRHTMVGGDYANASTMMMLMKAYEIEGLIKLASQDAKSEWEDETAKKGEREWSVPRAITYLIIWLEETARTVDRFKHGKGSGDATWVEVAECNGMTADNNTIVALENALKTLWKIANPNGVPADFLHSYEAVYNELSDFHRAIHDVACRMPVMFELLSPRDDVEGSIRFVFGHDTKDFRKKSALRSRYWWTTRWPSHHVAMPAHRFLVALSVFVVAVEAWGEMRQPSS